VFSLHFFILKEECHGYQKHPAHWFAEICKTTHPDHPGDRNNYLGASDIGYCPRKVILDRLHPVDHDLATLLRFQRGHMAEDIVANAFGAAGYNNFDRQVEAVAGGATPIRCHIDFVFNAPKLKAILEVKSVSAIPDGPHSSWESQLYMQMGALAEQYPDHHIKGAILAH